MGCAVYANGMSIACKVADGKTVAAMPDVCLSPPTPPAGPVPIPYPNTAMASDTDKGSKTVQIGGQEVMLKDQSTFKKSTGDEAATKSLGMGVVSHQIQGEVNFCAWSMDVKFEGENVPRHLDLTLHNEMCIPANTPTWPYLDKATVTKGVGACKKEIGEEKKACADCQPYGSKDPCSSKKCQDARKCMLAPFAPTKTDYPDVHRCCEGTTGHHVIPLGEFCLPRSQTGGQRGVGALNDHVKGYNGDLAPTICVEGSDHKEKEGGQLKEHGLVGSAYIKARLSRGIKNNQQNVKYAGLRDSGAESVNKVFRQCTEACIKKQLDNYHVKQAEIPADKPVCQASQQSDYAPKPSKAERM
jgi:hypothetical protein